MGRVALSWAIAAVLLVLAQAQVPVLLNGTSTTAVQTSNNQLITISVAGVNKTLTSTAGDVIALYAASSSNPLLNPPYKYKSLAYTTSGTTVSASVTFKLPNVRQNLIAVYLTSTSATAVNPVAGFPVLSGTIAGSNTIINGNSYEPTQIRLGATPLSSVISVTWTTGDDPAPQYVQFGTASGVYGAPVPATQSVTYTSNSICGTFASQNSFIDPGTFFTANMSGLQPATTYFYRVGALSTGGPVSQEYFFSSPPATGPQASVKVILAADMSVASDDGAVLFGKTDSPLNTAAGMAYEVVNNGYTLTLMNGDLAYADGYLSYWDVYMNQTQQFTAYAPHLTTDGNHERDWPSTGDDFSPNPGSHAPMGPNGICPKGSFTPFVACDSGGECGSITSARYNLPGVQTVTPAIATTSGPDKQKWYSYNYGPIHFLFYSSEVPFSIGSPQYQFIASDLASVDRCKTPWIVAGAHRPFYADSTDFTGLPDPSKNFTIATSTLNETDGDQYIAQQMRANLEPLFAQYNVDLYYNGHKHISYRTCPVRFGVCATARNADGSIQGTVYMTSGNAGRSLANPNTQLLQLNPAYSAFATLAYNGTALPDPFAPANGGFYVNATNTVYGYQRLFANATTLTVQPMDVTQVPAKPFTDPNAAFTLTRLPCPASTTPAATSAAPPVTTSSPPVTTSKPPVTTAAPPAATSSPPVPTAAPPATTPAPAATTPAPAATTSAPKTTSSPTTVPVPAPTAPPAAPISPLQGLINKIINHDDAIPAGVNTINSAVSGIVGK